LIKRWKRRLAGKTTGKKAIFSLSKEALKNNQKYCKL